MDSRLDTYDWEEAFAYADGFDREDILTISGMEEGENDGDPWIIYGQLKDGRWFYLCASCDYTGWDCQAGGDSMLAKTQDEIERLALTNQDRDRLGVKLKSKKAKKAKKKPNLRELVKQAKAEVEAHEDRRTRMEKLLQKIASLFKPSPLIFWFDQGRWDKFEDLRDAINGDGWDDEIHPVLEQDVPGWRDFYKCLQTRQEEGRPIGEPFIVFANSVIVFDALTGRSVDVVVFVQGGAFVVNSYGERGWEMTSREYGHPKTAAGLEKLLKEMGCRLA